MNPEIRSIILEAFASSKAHEFDGFVHAYLEAHPEQPEPLVSMTPPTIDVSGVVSSDECEPCIIEEAPTTKRKRVTKQVEDKCDV